MSERHGDFLIGLVPAQRNLQSNPAGGRILTRRGSYTFVKTAETTIRIIIPSIAKGRIQMKIVRLEVALDLRSKFARTASPEGFLSDFMLFREGQIGPVDPINRGRIFQCCRRHEGDIPRRECSGHLLRGPTCLPNDEASVSSPSIELDIEMCDFFFTLVRKS